MKRLFAIALCCIAFGIGIGHRDAIAQGNSSSASALPRVGSWGNRIDIAATNTGQVGPIFVPASTVTANRFEIFIVTAGVTCGTAPVLSIRDVTTSTNLNSQTITNGSNNIDSGVINVPIPGGDQIIISLTTGASGCGTTPSGISWNVSYR